MKNPRQSLPFSRIWTIAPMLVAFLSGVPAKADLVISAGSTTASAGSTGDAIDVDLTNTGSSSITLGGFSFGLSAADPALTFTEANISTVLPYLFAGDSVFGPVISFPPPTGPSITAADFDLSGFGITLNAGQEVGLAHLLFDIAPTASSGAFALSFTGWPTTSLSDAFGNDVPITAFVDGQITVPEPSGVLFTSVFLLFWIRRSQNPGRGIRMNGRSAEVKQAPR